ncbi:MAG TPA: trypsin-like peptidase domain-containing protein [Solirubrobacteraceae bacterium]|jgi:S1-C subfamily serine protease|nr:trypsin-like peptidase domain-containing protein [Solirubrobacteraceae bacterium]
MRRALAYLLAALAGGALGGGLVLAVEDDDGGGGVTRTVVERVPLGAGGEGLDAARIYERDGPGVVFVVADVVEPSQSPFDFGLPEQRGQSTGTGFVIDGDGNILTNAHVVENATRVDVRFSDARTARAEVRGRDRSSDLALLKVDPDGLDLHPLTLGSSAGVKVGDPTVAIGNPFGLERTLTTGVVSALQRRIEAPDGFTISDVIQTDAAINPGNSGGPLIDASGRVIGINSAIRTGGAGEGNIGIGFAVPIDTAKRVLPTLKQGRDVERAYLGVTTATVVPEMNLRVDRGAVVQDVAPLSPADEAGFILGDVIVRIAGRDVRSSDDVGRAVDERKPGDEIEVEIVRAGRRERVEVELRKRPTVTG